MVAPHIPDAPLIRQKSFSIEELGLRDPADQGALRNITRVARKAFSAQMALVAVFQDGMEGQLIVSSVGLPDKWADVGWVPLSKSFSQFVHADAAPLAVENVMTHPLGTQVGDREDLPYRSYLGAPIFGASGEALGALCVLDPAPHDWSEEDIGLLEDLAQCATEAILLRASILTSQQLQEQLELSLGRIRRHVGLRDSILAAFTAPDISGEDRLSAMLKAGCDAMNMARGAIIRVDGERAKVLAQHAAGDAPPLPDEWDYAHTLTAHLLTGPQMLAFAEPDAGEHAGRPAFDGQVPCCFIGTPLVLDGAAFGTLEFIGKGSRCLDDIEMESSIVSVIAMFTITQLETFSQIARLKKSEGALLQYILDLRAKQ